VLAGLIVQAATGRTLGHELTRRIFRPLGLRDTFFPINCPDIPGRNARGYSLPLGQEEGSLLDFTVYNPSLAWGARSVRSRDGSTHRPERSRQPRMWLPVAAMEPGLHRL
jgi:D-alanyl-D-alanine carboxypeptidase